MLNSINIMGRMVRDPELRRTGSGVAVANFTVAVERDFKTDAGEKETDFIDCVAWRQTGEFISKYFQKGAMIAVSGRLQIRSWQDNEGNARKTAEIVVANAYFGGGKSEGNNQGTNYVGMIPAQHVTPAQTEFALLDEDDSQLPF